MNKKTHLEENGERTHVTTFNIIKSHKEKGSSHAAKEMSFWRLVFNGFGHGRGSHHFTRHDAKTVGVHAATADPGDEMPDN